MKTITSILLEYIRDVKKASFTTIYYHARLAKNEEEGIYISKYTIKKYLTKLVNEGLITKNGRGYSCLSESAPGHHLGNFPDTPRVPVKNNKPQTFSSSQVSTDADRDRDEILKKYMDDYKINQEYYMKTTFKDVFKQYFTKQFNNVLHQQNDNIFTTHDDYNALHSYNPDVKDKIKAINNIYMDYLYKHKKTLNASNIVPFKKFLFVFSNYDKADITSLTTISLYDFYKLIDLQDPGKIYNHKLYKTRLIPKSLPFEEYTTKYIKLKKTLTNIIYDPSFYYPLFKLLFKEHAIPYFDYFINLLELYGPKYLVNNFKTENKQELENTIKTHKKKERTFEDEMAKIVSVLPEKLALI